VGALAAAALADRYGRILPVTIALAVQVATVLLLQGQMPWLQFAATAAVFQGFWNLTGPYMMGTIALNDTTGKVSLLIPTAQIGGFFLGPTIAGPLIEGRGLVAANIVAAACIGLALVLFIPVARRVKGLKGGGH
jgi:predicted MFS family arabinose efflux permease